MMNHPLISIALCTYNGEKYLSEQLDSIVKQTYKNIEIIAVDDCSSDNTLKILQKYAEQYPIIKVFSNSKNKGYSKNFEYAISLCKGEYISISDQDDIWMENKLELLLDKIKINDDLLVQSISLKVDKNGNSLHKTSFDKRSRDYDSGDPRILTLNNIFLGHSMLFKKTLTDMALPIPKHSTYDAWLGFVATNKKSVCVLNQVTTKFRQHQTNASKNWEGNSKLEKIKLLQQKLQDILTLDDLQHRAFFEELNNLVKKRVQGSMNIKLLWFLLKHHRVLSSTFNTSTVSKLNHLRKFYI